MKKRMAKKKTKPIEIHPVTRTPVMESVLLPRDNVIRQTIRVESGQILDGNGATYLILPNWDFPPILVEDASEVVVRNINIVVAPDALSRLTGIAHINNSDHVKFDNVRIVGSGDAGGTNRQIPCWIEGCEHVTLDNCSIGMSPKGWCLWLAYTRWVNIVGGEYHNGYYDGIKVGNDVSKLLIQGVRGHHNGRESAGPKATGDGIDITHGACDGVDIIGCHFDHNDNGITFKYAPWRDHSRSEERIPVYGVNIVGGSCNNNGNGIFLQGFSGEPPSGVSGANAPYPMGINVRGANCNYNTNSGIICGVGSYNLTDCQTHFNENNGLDISLGARWCSVRNHRAIANVKSNINQWGPYNSFYDCYCEGKDVLHNVHDRYDNMPSITELGVNWQWKPARGKAHGFMVHCYNDGSISSNGKPSHLPDNRWEPVE